MIDTKSTKPVVLVDSDTLLFSSCMAVQNNTIEVTHTPTGITKNFKNRTEFKQLMKSKAKEITEDYVVKDQSEAEDVSHALRLVKNSVERIKDNFSDAEVIFCCGADWNFRDHLPYPNQYKGNRTSMLKPLHLPAAQQYMFDKHNAVRAFTHETDDEVGILAYEALAVGRKAYILSPDGDSRQFDGVSLGKYHDTPDTCFDIKFMHDVSWSDKGIQTWGFPWMIYQASCGDITDGLLPRFLCKARYGEKGCYNDIHKLTTPEQLVQYLVDKYKQWYPEPFVYTTWDGKKQQSDWKHMLELYWKGTTMKRNRYEEPCFWKFIADKGLQVTSEDFN